MLSVGMDSARITPSSAVVEPGPVSHAHPTPKHRWTDLGLVLLLAFIPSAVTSAYLLFHSQPVHFTNTKIAAALFQELCLLTLFGVLYFRQGRKLSGIGLGFH